MLSQSQNLGANFCEVSYVSQICTLKITNIFTDISLKMACVLCTECMLVKVMYLTGQVLTLEYLRRKSEKMALFWARWYILHIFLHSL